MLLTTVWERRFRRSRKTTAMLAAVLSLGLVVSGCSSSDDDDDSSSQKSSQDSLLPEAEGKAEYPMTLSSPWGETVLDERPERVAVVGTTGDGANLLALGVTPVFIDSAYADRPWISDAVDLSAVDVMDAQVDEKFPAESIAQSEPDLIIMITSSLGDENYDALENIAPVLTGPDPSSSVPWEESLRTIGGALDLQEKSNELVESINDDISSVAEQHSALRGQSIAVLMQHPTAGLQLRSGPDTAFAPVVDGLGMVEPGFAERQSEGSSSFSSENFASIDADILLIFSNEEEQRELEQDDLFQSVPAVSDGKYAFFDQQKYASATLWPDAMSLPFAIENVLRPAFDQIDR